MTTLAIDLGGTSVRAAYRDPGGGLAVVRADDGSDSAPAAVWFAGPEDVRVGQAAVAAPGQHAGEVITSVRARLLRDPSADATRERHFRQRYETAESVAGYVLADAARRASAQSGRPITDVVAGVLPGRDHAAALRRAGAAAGLTVADAVAQPVAAALHYGAVADGVDQLAVVHDLGGSTLDISVLRIQDRNVDIVYSVSHAVGGRAWDEALARFLLPGARSAAPDDPDEVLLAALRPPAERLRAELSEHDAASVWLRHGPAEHELRLDRDQLAEVTGHLIDQAVEATRAAIDQVRELSQERAETILIAGGAGQMPPLAAALADRLAVEVRVSEPHLAVVSGLTLVRDFGLLFATYQAGRPPRSRRPAGTSRPGPAASAPVPPVSDVEAAADPEPPAADPEPPVADPEPPAADPEPLAADSEPSAPQSRTASVPGRLPPPPVGVPAAPPRPPGGRQPGQPPSAAPVTAAPPTTQEAAGAAAGLSDGGPLGTAPLAGRPVAELRAMRRGDYLLLTWIWPDGSVAANVGWRRDGGGPEHVCSARCSRRTYEHDGGFELPVGRAGVTITVEALVPGGDLADQPPSSLCLDACAPTVTFDHAVRRSFRHWTVTTTFVSDVACSLPPLVVVLGHGAYRPTSIRDGEVVHETTTQRLTAGVPAPVTFSLPAQRGTCWLVCLPRHDDAEAPDLRPAALHRLRIR
jgi:actin-like ATPase involved in cell morphogenesis